MDEVPAVCPHCETPVVEGYRFCPKCGADTTDPSSRPQHHTTSDQLLAQLRSEVGNRFEIRGILGRGGMGVVFRATETKLQRQVAIKVLPPEYATMEDVAARFQREARTAAQLDHPNIVPIYAVEDEGELQYFVMKFVDGHGLDDEQDGAMPWERVQQILYHAALALGHAHSRGVIHRDVKPANIMIDADDRVLLADFGISKALEGSTMTATGTVIGTPAYMSPEQASGGKLDGRSDQYSLGVVGYALLAGRLPFEEANIASYLYKQAFEDVPPLGPLAPDAPEYLVTALTRALSKQPDERFPSMEAFAAAVWPEGAESRGGAPVTAGRRVPTDASRARRRRTIGVSAAALVIVAAGTSLLLRPRAPAEPPGAPGASAAATGALDSLEDTATQAAASKPASDTAPNIRPQPVAAAATETRLPPSRPPATTTTTSPPPAPAVTVGYLTVGASPWGTVLIDGVETGNTPLTRHQLAPGKYVVQVRRTGYVTSADTVTITAGNPTILRKVLVPQ